MKEVALYNNDSEFLRNVIKGLGAAGIPYRLVDSYDESLQLLYVLADNLQNGELMKICAFRCQVFAFRVVMDTLVVGPFRKSNRDSCPGCLEMRLKQPHYETILSVTSGMTLPYMLDDRYLSFVVDFIKLYDQVPVLLDRYVNRCEHVNFAAYRITNYHVMQDEFCPVCGQFIEDEQSFDGRLQSIFKRQAKEYRQNPELDITSLKEAFIDPNTGIFRRQFRELRSKYVESSGVEMKVSPTYTEAGYGRNYSRTSAAKLGFLEGIERYCGIFDRRARSTLYQSYAELGDRAINPVVFGLHGHEEMNHPHFDLKVYNEYLPIYWKYAYSCKEQRKMLVPEQLVFFGDAFYRRDGNRFAYDSSNGMALGGSYEEAVLYGLLELIERDHFLCAWYNRLELQEIDVNGNLSPELERLLFYARLEGIEVHFYDISMELGIPSVWALAYNKNPQAQMKSYNAAAAHLVPEKAVESAALEVLTSLPIYEYLLATDERVRQRVAWLEGNPEGVTEFEDHVLFYASASNAENLAFVLREHEAVPFHEIYRRLSLKGKFANPDLKEDVEELIQQVLRFYMDVLIVNVTPPHIEQSGLCAVKVIVPGMLPMTFGNQHKRIIPDRLLRERKRRGLSEKFTVNAAPHPFP
ncbi:YcaO-like family protein [Paenibacillus azoreducens]|uniref:YcaO domain-containing protein n=1 Tax=Paenibacillus azoreducens TaxID=116718 RepID=A0A919YCI7_9BACL|nr:YcaO-like family protein [Paenibacillus azoreducens]GIO46290.1 hypothetical protein J34TS1_10550 [Paenibacillus azoreducens]